MRTQSISREWKAVASRKGGICVASGTLWAIKTVSDIAQIFQDVQGGRSLADGPLGRDQELRSPTAGVTAQGLDMRGIRAFARGASDTWLGAGARPVSASALAHSAGDGGDGRRHRPTDDVVTDSLVPVHRPPGLLMRLTEVAAVAVHRYALINVHPLPFTVQLALAPLALTAMPPPPRPLRLVLLVTNLRRTDVNEIYVRRVLQEQVGISQIDLDVMEMRHRYVFRLSVRHGIDPVVSFLRSQGLTGSALAHFLSRSPTTLARDVDESLVPLVDVLQRTAGPARGIGVLVRHPQLAEVPVGHIRAAAAGLDAAGASEDAVALLLWQYPDLYCRLAAAVAAAGETERAPALAGVRAALVEVEALQGGQPGVQAAEEELRTAIERVGEEGLGPR